MMYDVNVVIQNKPGIADPEGKTILDDLILRGGFSSVSGVRTARMLKITIQEKSKEDAQKTVRVLCDKLRIYNPLVSNITVTIPDQ